MLQHHSGTSTACNVAADPAKVWPAERCESAACLVEADLAGLQEVVEPAGRGNDDLHAVLQVPQLPMLWRATIAAPAQLRQQALTN